MKILANKALTLQEILVNLLGVKEDPCVSIIVNKDTPSPKNKVFQLAVKNAIKEAINKLSEKGYDKKLVKKFKEKLSEIENTIVYERDFQAVALFMSPNRLEKVLLPFEVKNKVIIDNSFEIRDLLRAVNRLFQYDVILLSKKKTRFFNGFYKYLQEVEDLSDIPEGMEYYLNSRINEKLDPGKAESEAMRLYTIDIDHFLRIYSDMHTPLIVMGDKKLVSYFKNHTKKPNKILAEIYGSYDDKRLSVIREKINEKINEYKDKRDIQLLQRIQPDIDRYSYVSGIQEVWTAAAMKEARILIVEEGYKVEGYSVKNGLFLIFKKPDNEDYEYHADAIDDLVEMVLIQGGESYFVKPGLLEKYDKILLTTRV